MINYKIIEEGKLHDQKQKINQDGFKLLVPIDFSESSYLALAYAMRLATMCKARIELFHVIDTSSLPYSENPLTIKRGLTSIELRAKNKLKSLIEIISENGVQVNSYFQVGNTETVIQRHIREADPDIIVVGKSGMEKLRSTMRGLRYPLLIVPPSIKPSLPYRILLLRDTKSLKEDLLRPITMILNGEGALIVAGPNSGMLKKLLFKYLIPIDGVEIELTRVGMKPAKVDLKTLLLQQKPDMICHVSRPVTFLERMLQKILKVRQPEEHDVPTLIIPSD